MHEATKTPWKYRFGPFEVNPLTREISKGGTKIKLRGQPYLILEILLARAGQVVTRAEIRERLWSADTFVDFEHGLNTSVKKLRQVLCDSAEEPRYVETVPRFGYRLIAPVEIIEEPKSEVATSGEKQEFDVAHDSWGGPATTPPPEAAPFRVTRFRSLAIPLVLAALVVACGLYYRLHKQVQRLTEKDTIVLADFSNSTGDAIFDDTLKTGLNVALRQSPFLNVLPDSEVARTLRLMTRPADTKLTPEVTRELCQRAGSKAYVAGAIGSLGSEYVLGLKAANCQSGDILAEEQVTAASKEKVLDALGDAASKLRAELGESLATVQKFDVPLALATTPSLEALKAYSLGVKVFSEKGGSAALPYSQRSVELDPNFAIAYQALGLNYYNLGELELAREYVAKAFQLREHASEQERLAITAYYYDTATGELDKAVQAYQEEIASYPRESGHRANLGFVYAEQGQYEKAEAITIQDLSLAPDRVITYENLATYSLAMQNFAQAQRIIQQTQARGLDDAIFHFDLSAIAFLNADAPAMAEQRRWFESKSEFENWGLAFASDSEAYAGHLKKARELTQAAVDSAIRSGNKENAAMWQAIAAQREAVFGHPGEARLLASRAVKLNPVSLSVEVEASLAFAFAEQPARAETLAQDINDRLPLSSQMQTLWLPAIQAQLALNQKKAASALTILQAATPTELSQIGFVPNISCLYPLYVRGEADLAVGQGRAAAAEFQKIIDHSGMVQNCWTGSLAHLGLARAKALESRSAQGAEAETARARSLSAYKDFFALWKDADADIPVLEEAKREYAKLTPSLP